MSELHALAERCSVGSGKRIKTNPEVTVPTELDDHVYLTPESGVIHPFTAPLARHTIYRSFFDWRSFSMHGGHDPTLTVKGGDLAYARRLIEKYGPQAFSERVFAKQIPGGCDHKRNIHEFDAALTLHKLSQQTLGHKALTATPSFITSIEYIVVDKTPVPIKDYLNNPTLYFTFDNSWRTMAGIYRDDEGLGDLLIDRYELVPSQYIYRVPDFNIRLDELCATRNFLDSDVPNPETGDYTSHRFPFDELSCYLPAFTDRGGLIAPAESGRKDTILRNLYRILARTYHFDPDEILPVDPIDDESYLREFHLIPERCQQQGHAAHVLRTFIDRTTETAALAHAHEHTFSRTQRIGSSFMPRNVSLTGAVLDLDTFGEFTRSPGEHIEQDVRELILSIACLRRVVATEWPLKLDEVIPTSYLSKLAAYGAPVKLQQTAARMLESHDIHAMMSDVL